MALFSKKQSDEAWLTEIHVIYVEAKSIVNTIDEVIEDNFFGRPKTGMEEFHDLLAKLKTVHPALPNLIENLKRVNQPESSIARTAHKNFTSSLKSYNTGVTHWGRFMSDYSGPVGLRTINETGAAQKAAFFRIMSWWNYFTAYSETASKQFENFEQYINKEKI